MAPSLVIVTSPMSSTSILSSPTGPSDVFTMFATAWTAMTAKDGGGEEEAARQMAFVVARGASARSRAKLES